MRTTITLDDDVAEAAKSLVRSTGKTLGQVVSELARRSLKARPSSARNKGLVPVFALADEEEIIPADRASRLLAKEGL